MVTITLYAKQKKRHRCTEQTFRLCGRRRGWDVLREKHWNKYTIKGETVGCMRQVLRAGALGRPRGMGWRGRREGGSGWGTHLNPRLIPVNVWQKPQQYCKLICLQLIKIMEKKKKKNVLQRRKKEYLCDLCAGFQFIGQRKFSLYLNTKSYSWMFRSCLISGLLIF